MINLKLRDRQTDKQTMDTPKNILKLKFKLKQILNININYNISLTIICI